MSSMSRLYATPAIRTREPLSDLRREFSASATCRRQDAACPIDLAGELDEARLEADCLAVQDR